MYVDKIYCIMTKRIYDINIGAIGLFSREFSFFLSQMLQGLISHYKAYVCYNL